MKRFLLFVLGTFSISATAGKLETSICLHNYTDKSHLIKIADIDNYDWSSSIYRPDKNLHLVRIKPNETICKREYVNSWSRDPHFTLIVDDVPSRMRYSAADRNTVDAWNVKPVWEDLQGNPNPAPVWGWGKSPFGDDWTEGDVKCNVNPPTNELPGCWGFSIGNPPF